MEADVPCITQVVVTQTRSERNCRKKEIVPVLKCPFFKPEDTDVDTQTYDAKGFQSLETLSGSW